MDGHTYCISIYNLYQRYLIGKLLNMHLAPIPTNRHEKYSQYRIYNYNLLKDVVSVPFNVNVC